MSGDTQAGTYSLDDVVRMRAEKRDPWADRITAPVDEIPDACVVMPAASQFDALVREWVDLAETVANLRQALDPIVGNDAVAVAEAEIAAEPDLYGTSQLVRRLHSLATDIRSARRDLQSFINRIEV